MIARCFPFLYEVFAAHIYPVLTAYMSNFHGIYVLRLPHICPTVSIYMCCNRLIMRVKLLCLADRGGDSG